jgi:hypothetical protein
LHDAAPDQLLSDDHGQERERRDDRRQRAKRGVQTGGVGRDERREALKSRIEEVGRGGWKRGSWASLGGRRGYQNALYSVTCAG